MYRTTISFTTHGEGEIVDLTPKVRDAVRASGVADGLVHLFVTGSTAAITTIEHEPGVLDDLRRALSVLAPDGIPYAHDRAWGDGNGRSHVKAAIVGPSLSVPVIGGALGTARGSRSGCSSSTCARPGTGPCSARCRGDRHAALPDRQAPSRTGAAPRIGAIMTLRIAEKPCATALTRSRIPGMETCINPYTGCEHACVYCYACFMKRFSGISDPWGSFVIAKTNIPDRLAHELRRDCPRRVMISSVTDPYQPAEERYRLTRRCLERLAPTGAEVSILTKSDLVLRDLDILGRMHRVEVGFTVTTADDETSKILEPGAPPSSRRFRASAELSAAGIPTWIFIAPLIPGIADTEKALAAIVSMAASAGARCVAYDPLTCYPTSVANLRGIFARHWPERLPGFEAACRDPDGFSERCRQLAARVWPRCGYRPP